MPVRCPPTGIRLISRFVPVSISEVAPLPRLATYTRVPPGTAAIATGLTPTGIDITVDVTAAGDGVVAAPVAGVGVMAALVAVVGVIAAPVAAVGDSLVPGVAWNSNEIKPFADGAEAPGVPTGVVPAAGDGPVRGVMAADGVV